MNAEEMSAGKSGFQVITYGDPAADTLLIQPVDDMDAEGMESEIAHIRELTGRTDFCMKAVKVGNWNDDLSPWQAPPVFGKEGFGGGSERTLEFILENVLPAPGTAADMVPAPEDGAFQAENRIFIGGYSLAGLFALWAACRTDRFRGVAAASPSVWFPRFTEYMRDHETCADAVYLSIGDREEKAKNPVMAQVGNAIREARELLSDAGKDCVLEYNPGNHFREPDLRTAKAFAWLISH